MDIAEFVALITCPLTGKIFFEPVLARDGTVYEEEVYIEKEEEYTNIIALKSFINSFVDAFPEHKNNRYVITKTQPSLKSHEKFQNAVEHIFHSGTVRELLKYNRFNMDYISETDLMTLKNNYSEPVMKHFIDNIVNINRPITETSGWTFLNILCNRFSGKHPEIVIYAIEKGANIMHACEKDLWTPLHQLAYFCNDKNTLMYAIDKHISCGGDLYMETQDKRSIMWHIAFHRQTSIIEYALSKLDLDNYKFKLGRSSLKDAIKRNSLITDFEKIKLIQKIDL